MKVEELLLEKAIDYKVSGRDFLTKCLNPDHEDTNPSMRIDNTTGIFHCFSCGFKGSVFKHFGALPDFLEIKRQIGIKIAGSNNENIVRSELVCSEVKEDPLYYGV